MRALANVPKTAQLYVFAGLNRRTTAVHIDRQ